MKHTQIKAQIPQYISYCKLEKGLDSKTLKAYRIDLLQFADFAESFGEYLSRETIQADLSLLHGQNKTKTIKRKVASMKAYMNYLEFEGLLASDPLGKMRIKLHEPFILPKTISLTTVNSLLQSAYDPKKPPTSHPTYIELVCEI